MQKFKRVSPLFLACGLFFSTLFIQASPPIPGTYKSGETPASSCPAPPPANLHTSAVTATTVTLEWDTIDANITYKVEGIDVTNGTVLPTIYTTADQYTYTNLVPGHTHNFAVSATYCGPGGTTGDAITIKDVVTGIFITELIVEFSNPCEPASRQGETPPVTGDKITVCVHEFTTPPPPLELDQGYIGALRYDGEPYKFAIAKKGAYFYVGEFQANPANPPVPNPKYRWRGNGVLGQYESVTLLYRKTNGEDLEILDINIIQFVSAPTMAQITFLKDLQTYGGCYISNNSCGGVPSGPRNDQTALSEKTAGTDIITAPFPNPFSSHTTLQYALAEPQPVHIQLFDLAGRLVQTVQAPTLQDSGSYETRGDGASLPNGLYFLHLQTGAERNILPVVKQEF
mgnify:CR=1 FL=1